MRIKQIFLSFLYYIVFFTLAGTLNAQVIHDPNDTLYKDLDKWSTMDYITQPLPLVRPYPSQLLDIFFDEVLENGSLEAREKAARYKAAISPNARFFHAGLTVGVTGQDEDFSFLLAPFADGTIRIRDWISASYALFGWASTKKPGEEFKVPGAWSPFPDFIPDDANIGDFSLYQDWTSMVAIGKSDFYLQAGISRSSVGPFYDNGVVVGPQAGRASHISVNFREQKWSFEALFLGLTASDDFGEGTFTEKYLIFHTFNFYPLRNFEFGFQEAVGWGGRFEPLYLIPFTWLFSAQSLGDFSDNSFMGFHVRWDLPNNVRLLGQLYIDDFQFNDFIRFKWNTKYKFAGEAGVVWTREAGILSSLAADYTMVFPYMYSHWNDPEQPATGSYNHGVPNYIVYSHRGSNLGTDLDPNSHRLSIRTSWRTLPDLTITTSLYLTQHGNASENVDPANHDKEGERHDGTIWDDGDTKDGNNYRVIRFLTQDVIDTRVAAGIGAKWELPFSSFGVFSLNMEYVFEYGWNRELIKDDNGFTNYWSASGSWRF
ncbi:MAG: hypothetical protein LBK25_08140 [Treponema sp.]|jgi:hypothetical protein|nr:hypothetical protein [Treponema sp.]